MSRNKDIKNLHYITGEPYSICRKKLKAAKWCLERALFSYDTLSITLEKISATFVEFGNAVNVAISKIDFKEILDVLEKEEA